MTLGEQLQRLGHDVTLTAADLGEMAEVARGIGLHVTDADRELPEEVDAVVSQHASNAVEMTQRYPKAPLVFVTHGIVWDCMLPPQMPGVVSAVVALNDRSRRRAAAAARAGPITRLRQPIDLERFSPRGALRDPPRRVLLMGNYLRGSRRDHLIEICRDLGLECVQIGAHGDRSTPTPEQTMGDVDIVIGYGRSVLEGMASGRAALVYDHSGGDGWVTPETYPALESNGFAGSGTDQVFDVSALRATLAEYRPDMGDANRELARLHHDANRHGVEMSELLKGLAPKSEVPGTPYLELARVLRNQWLSDGRAATLGVEAAVARERFEHMRAMHEHMRAMHEYVEREFAAFRATRRYRATAALARPLDRLRGLLRSTHRPGPQDGSGP